MTTEVPTIRSYEVMRSFTGAGVDYVRGDFIKLDDYNPRLNGLKSARIIRAEPADPEYMQLKLMSKEQQAAMVVPPPPPIN